jgi:hypothetical protein
MSASATWAPLLAPALAATCSEPPEERCIPVAATTSCPYELWAQGNNRVLFNVSLRALNATQHDADIFPAHAAAVDLAGASSSRGRPGSAPAARPPRGPARPARPARPLAPARPAQPCRLPPPGHSPFFARRLCSDPEVYTDTQRLDALEVGLDISQELLHRWALWLLAGAGAGGAGAAAAAAPRCAAALQGEARPGHRPCFEKAARRAWRQQLTGLNCPATAPRCAGLWSLYTRGA